MQVTVNLFANFRAGRFATATRQYAAGTRIIDVITELAIPEPDIGIVLLNNRHAELHQSLEDGAKLSLFPLVGGG